MKDSIKRFVPGDLLDIRIPSKGGRWATVLNGRPLCGAKRRAYLQAFGIDPDERHGPQKTEPFGPAFVTIHRGGITIRRDL